MPNKPDAALIAAHEISAPRLFPPRTKVPKHSAKGATSYTTADYVKDGRYPSTKRRQDHSARQEERGTTLFGPEPPAVHQEEDKTSTEPGRRYELPRTPSPTARNSDSEFEPDWPAEQRDL